MSRPELGYGPADARLASQSDPDLPPTFAELVAPPQPETLVDGSPEFPATAPPVQITSRGVSAGSDRTKRFLKLVAEQRVHVQAFAW